jgi:hypothetical protein
MINGCAAWDSELKPVCDNPDYCCHSLDCEGESPSLWIGQKHHLVYPPQRNTDRRRRRRTAGALSCSRTTGRGRSRARTPSGDRST